MSVPPKVGQKVWIEAVVTRVWNEVAGHEGTDNFTMLVPDPINPVKPGENYVITNLRYLTDHNTGEDNEG